jgi:hypothetical protein
LHQGRGETDDHIATIETRHAQRIGKLAKPALKTVMRQIHTIISEAS